MCHGLQNNLRNGLQGEMFWKAEKEVSAHPETEAEAQGVHQHQMRPQSLQKMQANSKKGIG